MTKLGGLALSAAALVGAAGCAQQARFTQSTDLRAAGAPAAIEARTENGSITLSRGEAADVELHGVVRAVTQERADATELVAERGPDGKLTIWVRWPEGKRLSNEACSLEIKAPSPVAVRLFTSNGDIDARGMAGDSEFRTSNGEVVVSDHAGAVRAQSSNGDLVLTGIGGAVDGDTSNGDIDVRGAAGAVRAESSNGEVSIALGAGSAGPLDVETSNGSIRVQVGEGFAGVVEVGTSNGSVEVTGGPVQISREGRRHAVLTFGTGGEKSRLRTSNGTVTVTAAR